jgi:hypothetical protein
MSITQARRGASEDGESFVSAASARERRRERLRENVRRRTAQARALGATGENDEPSQA